jgi:hypothetical protein
MRRTDLFDNKRVKSNVLNHHTDLNKEAEYSKNICLVVRGIKRCDEKDKCSRELANNYPSLSFSVLDVCKFFEEWR